tara:strand:+ start:499 stop:894 length:396 start_codon:yes stop_codon:yes gene_type:complete
MVQEHYFPVVWNIESREGVAPGRYFVILKENPNEIDLVGDEMYFGEGIISKGEEYLLRDSEEGIMSKGAKSLLRDSEDSGFTLDYNPPKPFLCRRDLNPGEQPRRVFGDLESMAPDEIEIFKEVLKRSLRE